MRPQDIEVGTSGWVFDDWAGTFYPLRVPRTQWLEYYGARFAIGEINSTYYRIAPAKTFAAIARRTPDAFRTFVKVHADVTHHRREPQTSVRMLLDVLRDLRDTGKLLGLLAQFPSSFHCQPASLEYVLALRDSMEDVPLCVEFRHASWDNPQVLSALRERGLTWVCADEPRIESLLPFRIQCTTDVLYLRLHGRNAPAWYDHRAGSRYDYDYAAEELTQIGTSILGRNVAAKRAYVLFNNCYAGQAPRNATWLKRWLASIGGEHAIS